ncbi:hypothetical protein [Paenibacillus pini]|uniref:Hydrolase n=1 Tax=Paenibacillus pini JCM 16418 TaxID=1236976 RepID=W7YNW0_9BACL|nr:hypothetical protein [Paenibacillus pini]GAF09303.1 hydrolase [Paenibacillus pini JCM 16418]
MEKNKYFVSVQAKSIMLQQGDAAYELEIFANDEEINKIKGLFDSLENLDNDCLLRTPNPGMPYHHDNPNDKYDHYLQEIYETLHELGTDETKHFVSSITDQLNTMGWHEEHNHHND